LRRLAPITAGAAALERILTVVQPKLVLVSCYYNFVGMALCLASSRRGVPCIDVQHGVTHKNPAYEGFGAFPTEGYALLPSRFWCWSEWDAEPVRAWPSHDPVRRVFVGGHPWHASFENGGGSAALLRAKVESIRGSGLNVLVSLSNSSGFSEEIRSVLRSAPREWTFWIRLHPRMQAELRDVTRWCGDVAGARAHVSLPTELPLPLLLQCADVHMAHNSTVLQEATAARLPSVAVDRRALSTFAREIASGWVAFAEGEAVVAALESQSRRRVELSPFGAYASRWHMSEALGALLE
jgi:hypothetical protein